MAEIFVSGYHAKPALKQRVLSDLARWSLILIHPNQSLIGSDFIGKLYRRHNADCPASILTMTPIQRDPAQAQMPFSAMPANNSQQSTPHAISTDGWQRRLGRRFAIYWPIKCLGTTAFMALFFWSYFWILDNPIGMATVMPNIWLDHWVGFAPAAFPVYVSLWLYVFLAPATIGNLRALLWFGIWVGAMCLFCLAIFWWFPTQIAPAPVDWSLYPGLAWVKGLDASGNACPSLHVASAVFSFFWLRRILTQLHAPAFLQWISLAQGIAIAWSTMATLQHVALDVFAGIAVGVTFAVLSLAHIKNTT